MRTQEGKEEYTALDYFRDRFALRYGGTDMRQNGLYQSAGVSAEERLVRDEERGMRSLTAMMRRIRESGKPKRTENYST